MKEGRKRKVIISDVKITDAGHYKCTTNADVTEAEIVVKCTYLLLGDLKCRIKTMILPVSL